MRGDQFPPRVRVAAAQPSELDCILNLAILLAVTILLLIGMPGLLHAESTIEVSGEVSAIIAEEFSVGFEQTSYSIIVGEHTVYQLFFNDEPPVPLRTGDYAFVTGELVSDPTWGDGILVSQISVLPIAQSVVAAATSRSALVMVVNFQDTSASCSNNAAASMVWTGSQNIDGLYQESSFGSISFPRDTNGDNDPDVVNVTLSENMGSSCDYFSWALAADTKAEDAGYNLNDYQHRVYILPSGAPCGWAGLGNLGCSGYCRAWTLYCSLGDVLAHEFGHNIGLNHAGTDSNNDGTLDTEYGDTSGIMGYGGVKWRHFNAPHKANMGWIPSNRIQTVTNNGSYSVAVNELKPNLASPAPPTDYQIVRTSVPGQANTFYYFSYRAQQGNYSTQLPGEFRNEISIHRISTNSTYSALVTTVGNGESWSDGEVSLLNVSTASTYATFSLVVANDANPGDGGGDDDDGGVTCSVSGRVLKNGNAPRNYRKLRIIVKNRNTSYRAKTSLSADGSYSVNGCESGSTRIRVRRLKTRRRRARNISATTLTLSGSNTVNFSL